MAGRRWSGKAGILWTGASVLALLTLVLLLYSPGLRLLGTFLVVEDQPAPADLIFLLNGDPSRRALEAARLFHAGWAPRIVISEAEGELLVDLNVQKSPTHLVTELLEKLGVPAEAIRILPFPHGTTSTADEARALAQYLSEHPAEEILVVTSDYHTRRARWTISRELPRSRPRLRLIPVPGSAPPTEWWRREDSFLLYIEEYLKFFHSWAVRQ